MKKNKKEIVGISKCCGADIYSSFVYRDNICSECGKPCAIMSEEEMFFANATDELDIPDRICEMTIKTFLIIACLLVYTLIVYQVSLLIIAG